MYTLRTTALIGLMALLMFTHTGCFTMMGEGVGATVDAIRGERYDTVPGWQTKALKPDMPVTLTLRDSTRIEGRCIGRQMQMPQAYAERYAAWQTQTGASNRPVLGERLTVFQSLGRQISFIFQGFDYRQKEPDQPPQLYLLAQRPGRSQIERVRLEKKMTDSRGAALNSDTLNRMFLDGQVPVMSALSVMQMDTTRVAIDRISSLSVASKTTSRRRVYGPDRLAEGFKTGAQVMLTLRDSTQAQGVFGGLVRLLDSLYAERYAAWQTGHDGVSFPRMGERITLTGYYGKRTEYLFYCFSYRTHLAFRRIASPCPCKTYRRRRYEGCGTQNGDGDHQQPGACCTGEQAPRDVFGRETAVGVGGIHCGEPG
ncbi:MAG: hypothetical protein FJY97_04925 [candidate division Zixibacteria bacterium]|nr:hypothetical protein [candidate division Zixibacteria bacterium]